MSASCARGLLWLWARGVRTPEAAPKKTKRGTNPRSLANLVAPWKRGQCGNPGGRPKHDVAQEIAQAVFTENAHMIYQAFVKALMKGNIYAFKVLADRAYGKVKETRELTGADGCPIGTSITVRFVGADGEDLERFQGGA